MIFPSIKKKKDVTFQPDSQQVQYLEKLKQQIDCAYANYNYVVDPMLIDSWIYEINATCLRYEFYLNQLKRTPS